MSLEELQARLAVINARKSLVEAQYHLTVSHLDAQIADLEDKIEAANSDPS